MIFYEGSRNNSSDGYAGNPSDVQLTGLSAGKLHNGVQMERPVHDLLGAHSVHQILHHVSLLPDGENAPFQSAILQSNGILYVPTTASTVFSS